MQLPILQSLSRQTKGLLLLGTLLDQELQLLKEDSPQAVSGLEFSIQELLRQIAMERACVRTCVREMSPEASRLTDVMDRFSGEEQTQISALIADIDNRQQQCARKAAMNAEIAQALRDQSQSLLAFFRKQVMPKTQETYSNHGRWTARTRTATLISGRL
jgi:flagellar biosynthesis/type III secretory pathway chaperone